MPRRRFLHLLLALALISANTGTPAATAFTPSSVAATQEAKATTNSAAPDISASLAAIEKTVEEQRKEKGIPGLSLVIVKDDRVIYAKGFGQRDVEHHLPVTPDTLFAIGSCTKAFTAMAAVISQDEGKLSLDDSPKKYLPFFKIKDPAIDEKITLRDLLSHRSGLAGTDIAWYTGTLNRQEVIRVAGQAKPTAQLGEKFQYQNVMYSAAGEVVAAAQHSTWEKVISGKFLKPLGMKATRLSVREMQRAPDYSFGYDYNRETGKNRRLPTRDLTNIAPAGAINSNAREMAQWLRLLLGGGVFEGQRFVSAKGFEQLFTKQTNIAPNVGYALGWAVLELDGHKIATHDGGIDGFNSEVTLMPDQKLGFVLLTNVSQARIMGQVRNAIFDNLVLKPQAAPTASAANATSEAPASSATDLQREVGTYNLAEANIDMEVSLKDGHLVLTVTGQPAYQLENVGGRRYKLADPAPEGFFITFRPVKDNAAETEAYLEQPQGNYVLHRRTAAAAEFTAPIGVDELMSKTIAAYGGEENLRKHKSMTSTYTLEFPNQGVQGEGTSSSRAPNAAAQTLTFSALGKKLGTVREFFDGTQGGTETSFSVPDMKSSKQLDDARIRSDFYALANWKTLFKTVTIKKLDKVGGDDVYVVLMTPERGHPITDYISTKSFLILKRETFNESNDEDAAGTATETYSDYRTVDGVMIPFKTVQQSPGFGEAIIQLKEVKFDVPLPDSLFHAQK